MNEMTSLYAPPKASAMIEALRGLGYSTATALADIVDNSVSAKSKSVDIIFKWQGAKSVILLLDNGEGMDVKELELAMRLGEKNPLDDRSAHDLGRFGLGLKTASFSQARRLTVASIKHGTLNCFRWDLDILTDGQNEGWYLHRGPDKNSKIYLDILEKNQSGTLVLLENLDRIVTPNFKEQDFLDLIDKVENHLAMVFHRYLSGSIPKLKLSINGRCVSAWDPFLVKHSATWTSQNVPIRTNVGIIEVQCHVLPHKDRLDLNEYERAGGLDGWTAQQGFYVYRNERLLVAGSWLGLGRGRSWTKEEAHRLARIRLDIPNSADEDWKIDIRKSTARPPVNIREKLTWLAEDTRARARKVFAHRGQSVRINDRESFVQAWRAEYFNGGMRYKIDENHVAIKSVLEDAGVLAPQIKAMLRVIEETIPVQRIWLDTAESKETPRTGFAGESVENISSILTVMYRSLVNRQGISPKLARESLLNTDPFNNYPELISLLPDNI